jgi:hypothetical protein
MGPRETLLAMVVFSIAGYLVGSGLHKNSTKANLIQSCELTGTHIIDNDTVLVCGVVRRDDRVQEKPKASREHNL